MSLQPFQDLVYLPGFGNHVASEALPGALPVGQNSPQVCSYGLYAEQLSGSAFTAPRHKNLRTWQYRIRPSVLHDKLMRMASQPIYDAHENLQVEPNQLRWSPYPLAKDEERVTFVDGLQLYASSGDSSSRSGISIYMYAFNASMEKTAMYNADGDFLIVPQLGTLAVQTEMGNLVVEPCEILVVPRGVKFRVCLHGESTAARGYVAEVFKGHFELPGLGPIGANGLANPRDFLAPSAAYEDLDTPYVVVAKYMHTLYTSSLPHSPFDVVAWHGNYYPFKYDLRLFNTINTVSYDHADPSIFTVLTCATDEPGTALLDFVIFPPRWMVAEKSFRPPYFHRNCMSEFMGMVYGKYDGKGNGKDGFLPGGASLHSCMTAHGPDALTFLRASSCDLQPQYFGDGLAFMFESSFMLKLSPYALETDVLQRGYLKCWQALPKLFNPSTRSVEVDWTKELEIAAEKTAAFKLAQEQQKTDK
jgi:homogentisate 1,2-dioxygenase